MSPRLIGFLVELWEKPMIGHWVGGVFLFFLGIIGIGLSKSLPVENSEELGTSFFPLLISIFLLVLSGINLANLVGKGRSQTNPFNGLAVKI